MSNTPKMPEMRSDAEVQGLMIRLTNMAAIFASSDKPGAKQAAADITALMSEYVITYGHMKYAKTKLRLAEQREKHPMTAAYVVAKNNGTIN